MKLEKGFALPLILLGAVLLVVVISLSKFLPEKINKLRTDESTPKGKIIFSSTKNILGLYDLETKTEKALGGEAVSVYKYFNRPVVSNNGKGLFITLLKSTANSDKGEAFIVDPSKNVFKKVDIDKIKSRIGKQFEVTIDTWAVDDKKLVLHARDIENFLDNKCCEGGDYRTSKNLILEYDIETEQLKTIYTKSSPPIYAIFYDSQRHILAYSDNYEAKGHFVDLQTDNEYEFVFGDTVGFYNYPQAGRTFFAEGGGNNERIKIYSFYEPLKALAEINSVVSASNYVYWSPRANYFTLVKVSWKDDKNIVDNTNDKQYSTLLEIYGVNGKLILKTTVPRANKVVFSPDGKYFLTESDIDFEKRTCCNWKVIKTGTGKEIMGERSLLELGTPLLWVY